MQNVSFYLSKYLDLGLKEKNIKKTLIEAIREVCNIKIEQNKIKIDNKSIRINLQGPEKSEIFIKNEQIQKKFLEKIEQYKYKIDKKKIF